MKNVLELRLKAAEQATRLMEKQYDLDSSSIQAQELRIKEAHADLVAFKIDDLSSMDAIERVLINLLGTYSETEVKAALKDRFGLNLIKARSKKNAA